MKRTVRRLSVLFILCFGLSQSFLSLPTLGQEEDQQRDIEAKEILNGRRHGQKPRPGNRYYYQVKVRSNGTNQGSGRGRRPIGAPNNIAGAAEQAFPTGLPTKNMSYMTLGMTLWRVRVATETESKDPKIPKERMSWDREDHAVMVSRASDQSRLPNQDLLQMTIEYLPYRNGAGPGGSNRAAYLYVINREQFPDGSFKNARLIFPTLLTYAGDNRLLPGKTVTLPGPKRPFRIKRDVTQTQAFETYTLILSPSPLDAELPREISNVAMDLTPELVRKWEQQMGITEARADLRNGIGQARSQRELQASGDADESRGTEDAAEDLTQDDLPPQTVYRKVAKPDEGMLVIVRIPFGPSAPKP